MTVLSFGLDAKFGPEGLAALGIDADDRLPNAAGRNIDDAVAGGEPPVLLLFHGPRTRTDRLLERHGQLHVLHVKTTLHRYGSLRERERELPFAAPSLPGEGQWARQTDEVRGRLRRLVDSFRRGRPDWALIEAPAIPEHLVACLLTALTGCEAPAAWRRGFEREAAALAGAPTDRRPGLEREAAAPAGREPTDRRPGLEPEAAAESGEPSWDDRRDAAKMRGFLRQARTGPRHRDGRPAAEGDGAFAVVALPGLPCDAAREAGRCRHSFLENAFLGLDDRGLAAWLDDEREVRAFEASARVVRDNAAGFSPVGMLSHIGPLARLPARDLELLRDALAGAFERAFAPAETARMLGVRLEALRAEMRRRGPGDTATAPIARIRQAARALRDEMARLPDGFWLPPPGDRGEPDPRG